MRKIQYILYVAFVALFFTACQEDDFGGAEQGGIRIALADGTTGVDVTTRSTPSELFDGFKKKFKFQIKGGDNYDQTHEWTEDVIPLAAGVYEIIATCGTEQAAGVVEFDKPCYTGKAEGIKVEVGKEAKAEVKCKVTNALVSIKFADEEEFEKYCPNASIQISVGSQTEKWANLKESAYFKAGSSLSTLQLWKSDQEDTKIDLLKEAGTDIPKSFAAGDHLIITLSIGKANGNIIIKISQVEVDKVTIEETIPMEWLPKPKMEVDGFTGNQLVMYESETPTAKFNFNLSSGLQELKFTLDFDDETYQSLNKEYVLSTLSESDKQALTGAGVVLPSIGDKGNVSLDFSGLAAKLTGSTEGGALDNVIKLAEVKANNRVLDGGEQTYTIQTHAPEFDIKVYPGNTWTKQFTANTEITKGNAEVIREGMTFEYSTNGSDWTFSKDSLITGLTPDTNYKVRLKFGKHYKEVDVKTYPVIPLENGDMEDWAYEITNDARNPLTENIDFIYWKKWFPWSSVSTPSIWNTVNQTTTQDGNNPSLFLGWKPTPPYVGCCYVANSGTIPVEGNDAHKGKSALIKTVGWGSGSTAAGGTSIIKKVTPGELYLGTYDLSSHQPIYGIGYKSRPTNVKFWCKYEPKSSDLMIAQIVIMDEEGKTIGNASVPDDEAGATGWTKKTLSINYIDKEKEPAKMYILFKCGTSTDPDILDKSGVNLSDGEHVGSKLYIDDVELVYDK